jgi:hypothetical protein
MSSVRFGGLVKILCAKSEGFRGETEIGGRDCRRFGVAVDLIFFFTLPLFFKFQMVKLLAVWTVDNRDSGKPHISHPSIYIFSIEPFRPFPQLSFLIKIIRDNIKYVLFCVFSLTQIRPSSH